MQQRYYDPVIGRFYSNDPEGFSTDNPMMFNRYAYANNNPYKFTDPDGGNPKLLADFALNLAINYVTTGNIGVTSAARDTLEGAFNPIKTLEKANKLGGIIYKRISPTGEEYIGRAKSWARYTARQNEHKSEDGVDYRFSVLDDTGKMGRDLQFAEESHRLVRQSELASEGKTLQNKIPAMNRGKFINHGKGVFRKEGSRIKTKLKDGS